MLNSSLAKNKIKTIINSTTVTPKKLTGSILPTIDFNLDEFLLSPMALSRQQASSSDPSL